MMTDFNKTITLGGTSWKNYIFNLYSIDTSFNPVKAIYIVCELTENNSKYSLIYIWQTDDLSTRFVSHHKQACFDRNWANCIGVLQVARQEDRDFIEKDLISRYKPMCNEQLA